MAKYCKDCGKELKDGVCDCKKGVKTSNTYVSGLLDTFKGMFTKPVDTLKEFIDDKNFITGLISIGISILLSALLLCLAIKEIFGSIGMLGFGSLLGVSADISYVKIFLTSVFVLALTYAAVAGIFYLLVDKIFKAKSSYQKMITLLGASSMIMIATLILTLLFIYISTQIMTIIFLAGTTLYSLYLYKGLKFTAKIDENKLGYIMIITNTILYIVFTMIVPNIIK